ncbi:hypothetical protein LAZ67_6003047 [Cordylochernes scorpioides]|uniref:DDE-1 domain-containing protein n=1 Tax=Cordylochernes scorpioides TaxID=51811 RepID=A0ABY6KND9_9ARAC|nr:hypothetical protein LAZ67_6003047 [Cordylochernes scorpioides]
MKKLLENILKSWLKLLKMEDIVPIKSSMLMKQDCFGKKMPTRTYIAKSEKNASGFKAAKDRVTLLLCSNASGDRMLKTATCKSIFKTTCIERKILKYTARTLDGKQEGLDHVALAIAEIKSQTLNACWKAARPECVSKRNESNRTTIVTSDIISIAKEIGGEGFDDFGEHDLEELLVEEALNDILESMVETTKDFETVDSELEDVIPLDEKLLREGLQPSDEEAARKYPEKLAKIIKDGGYCAHQIFNADETGLFWKKMPTRTYIAKSEKNASGFKAAKDRVTLLLCSNASGDRMLKPLLVNRSLKPRALKGKDLNTLPVHWMANKKAWVTTAIFTEWFNKCFVPEVENYMKEMGLEFKILLILDNAPDHVALAIAEIKSQTLNACWKAARPECVSKRNESNRTTIVTSDIISIAKEIGGEGFDDFGEHYIEELLVDEALNDDILESMVETTKDFETVDSELEDVTPLDEKLLREGLQLSDNLENIFYSK